MRVLLLAESCNPDWPSLPVVGYKAARALAEECEVTVATHVRNRPAIERDGLGRAEVVFIDNERVAGPMYRLSTKLRGGHSVGWTTHIATLYPAYLAFEREVKKRFRPELEQGRFDVVHRVTPMSPTIPSPIARWCPVPFVLGPLNGGLRWPPEFTAELRREREWLTYLRGAYRCLPYYRSTYARAAAILAGFEHTIADLPASARGRTIDFPEVGIDPKMFAPPERRAPREQLTFLYAGRFVPYKCPDVCVMAFAADERLRRHKLVMVGDGPERPRVEALIAQHGLGDRVQLLGWKTQAEVGALMREADVFFFPSIRELGAGVVVEAMACGLPPAVVDYGAPGGLVREDCGVRVPIGDKAALAAAFGERLGSLAEDRELVERLGQAAHARAVSRFSWAAKARKTLEVYDWVLGRRRERPTFDSPPERPGAEPRAGRAESA